MGRRRLTTSLIAVALLLLSSHGAQAAGETFVVYGADTTAEERIELALLFGAGSAERWDLIGTPEMVAALQGTGLPVAPTDKSISSTAFTCLNAGDGLTVRTQNITRMSAAVYANALITAGVTDGNVLVAAPAANPVTGETALVGVLKAFPQCHAGRQPDPARVRLAYEQVARTVALAGARVDLGVASAALLQATQQVILGQLRDDASIGASLDAAMRSAGVPLDPVNRADLVSFLKRVAALDHGAYAKGYQVQQVSPAEVRVTATGGQAQPPAPNTAQPTGLNQPSRLAPQSGAVLSPAVERFTGEARQTDDGLSVGTEGEARHYQPAPDVTVVRNGRPVTLSEVRSGDTVTVITNPDGTAQRIEATSERDGSTSLWAWLMPLLLGLALLGLLYWLLAPRRDGFILERVPARRASQRTQHPRT